MYEYVRELGSGEFNTVFLIKDASGNHKAFKVQKPEDQIAKNEAQAEEFQLNRAMDTILRSLRVWSEVNPDLQAEPFKMEIQGKQLEGWICPYIVGRAPTKIEIAKTVIDIYNCTKRIVTDASGYGNIITTSEGKSICVDIGWAVRIDNEYGPFQKINDELNLPGSRRGSKTGIAQFRFCSSPFQGNPKKENVSPSTSVLKALIFLNRHRPDLDNVDFLLDGLERIEELPKCLSTLLAEAYDMEFNLPFKDMESERISIQCHIKEVLQLVRRVTKQPILVSQMTNQQFIEDADARAIETRSSPYAFFLSTQN